MHKCLLGRSDDEEKILSHNSSHHHTHCFWSLAVGFPRLVVLPYVAFHWEDLTEVQTRHLECPQKCNRVGILADNFATWNRSRTMGYMVLARPSTTWNARRERPTSLPEKRRRCEPQRSQRRPTGVPAGEPHETHRASAVLNREDGTHGRDPSIGQAAKRCAWRDN